MQHKQLTVSKIRTMIREALEGYSEGTLGESEQVLRDYLRERGEVVPEPKTSSWVDIVATVMRQSSDPTAQRLAIEAWNDMTIGWELVDTKKVFSVDDDIWCGVIAGILRQQLKLDAGELGNYAENLDAQYDMYDDQMLEYTNQYYREAASQEEDDVNTAIEDLWELGVMGMHSFEQVESAIRRCDRHIDFRDEIGVAVPPVLRSMESLIPLKRPRENLKQLRNVLKPTITTEQFSAVVKHVMPPDVFLRESEAD